MTSGNLDPTARLSPRDTAAHFATRHPQDLLIYLGQRLSAQEMGLIRRDASGADRAVRDEAPWVSYAEMRSLLEAAGRALGGAAELAHVVPSTFGRIGVGTEILEVVQAIGSPDAVYAAQPGLARNFTPILQVKAERQGQCDWIMRVQLPDGFEFYPELRQLLSGLFSAQTVLFGLDPAEVTELADDHRHPRGTSACIFRVRWAEVDEQVGRRRLAELSARMSMARLQRLQRLVGEVVGGGSPRDVLREVMVSAARAVGSPQSLLLVGAGALEADRVVLSEGMDAGTADRLADELHGATAGEQDGRLVVEVRSGTRHFGYLAVIDPVTRLFAGVPGLVSTYAQLAASYLDAQRAAGTTRALLGLSSSLAELATPDEIAGKLARAAPQVSGCDRVLVYLVEPGDPAPRLAASHGHDEPSLTMIAGLSPQEAISPGATLMSMTAGGNTLGWVLASMSSDSRPLQDDDELAERLQSLTTQGATAIANARLLEQIRHNALHDPLTGLANRALILDRLEQMLARNYRAPAPVAVLFVDLDGFKNINDTLGHDAGDDVIRAVAARLCTAVREADTIGRLGGDEFVILLEGSTTGAGLTHVAERVLAVLAEPLAGERFSGKPLALTASVGIATGVRTSAGELLHDADVALYNAKAAGKSRYVLFQPQMQTSAQQRLLLETDLRKALPNGQLFLVFQPVYDLASNEMAAVEALPRWRHPARGMLEADDFIPVIQETEAIIEVGGWVLDTACAAANRLRQGGRHLVISVAVSIRELESEDFLRRVQHALTSSGLDPALLMLEITETALMRRATDLAPRLQRLRALGVRVAIDHFGAGYSSLACLRQLPVDTIKLDNSLISALPGSDDSQAIVHSLVQLGKALRLGTIAEDTQEPEQWPRRQRESSQNHLAARPYDIDELTNFLHQQEP